MLSQCRIYCSSVWSSRKPFKKYDNHTFFTDWIQSPGYFLFVNNQVDPNDFAMQIQEDIGTKWLWSIYNKKPWENNYSKAVSNKRQEMLAKTPHIECQASDSDELMTALRKWAKVGHAAKRFGAHFKGES